MEDTLVPIFGMLTSFGTFFGLVYLFFTTRHKERLALIEKGVDAKIFQTNKSASMIALKIGMLGIGIGMGVIFGYIFAENGIMHEDASYPAMIFLIGGICLVLNFMIERKILIKENGAD